MKHSYCKGDLQADELEIASTSSLQRTGSMNLLLLTALYVLFLRLFLVYAEVKSFDREMTGLLCTRRAAVCNIILKMAKKKNNKDIENSC